MKNLRVFFICNAMEDQTRMERAIISDSPAASKKVFMMAKALKSVGVSSVIISMGRGQTSSFKCKHYQSKIVRHNGVPIIYAPFNEVPILSQFISFIALPYILFKFKNFDTKTSVVFYNRTTAYISSLLMSLMLGYKRVLDLEDGDFFNNKFLSIHQLFIKTKRFIYSKLCNGGTILACRSLSDPIYNNKELCYYGAIENISNDISINNTNRLKILLGGTVSYDTGAGNLIKAIKFLREHSESWSRGLEFCITGKGDCIDSFKELENTLLLPRVKVFGRLSDKQYSQLISDCSIGLALKPNHGKLADTTFPSKVIEIAGSGLLVLTTDISDVRYVLGDGALYLEDDKTDTLVEALKLISTNKLLLKDITEKGLNSIRSICSLNNAGSQLFNHMFNEKQ